MWFGVVLLGVTGALRRLYDDLRGVEGVGGIGAEGESSQCGVFMLEVCLSSWPVAVTVACTLTGPSKTGEVEGRVLFTTL